MSSDKIQFGCSSIDLAGPIRLSPETIRFLLKYVIDRVQLVSIPSNPEMANFTNSKK